MNDYKATRDEISRLCTILKNQYVLSKTVYVFEKENKELDYFIVSTCLERLPRILNTWPEVPLEYVYRKPFSDSDSYLEDEHLIKYEINTLTEILSHKDFDSVQYGYDTIIFKKRVRDQVLCIGCGRKDIVDGISEGHAISLLDISESPKEKNSEESTSEGKVVFQFSSYDFNNDYAEVLQNACYESAELVDFIMQIKDKYIWL